MKQTEIQNFLSEWKNNRVVLVSQRTELAEFFGFETRNKYELKHEDGAGIGFVAEQGKGVLGFLFRQFLGHWRRFNLNFYNRNKELVFTARHPFRFFFQRFEIVALDGQVLGVLQQRFGILRKKFDLQNAYGGTLMKMRSGFLQFWTFPVFKKGSEVAVIRKKWSGIFKEAFMDADQFRVEFHTEQLTEQEKLLILASSIFVDLQYFEYKAD